MPAWPGSPLGRQCDAYDLLGRRDPAGSVSDVNRVADTGAYVADIDQASQDNDTQYLAPRRA